MQSLLFNDRQCKNLCRDNNQQWDYKSAPQSTKDTHHASKDCHWEEIAITNCCHGDYNAPDRCYIVIEVFLVECSVILDLENSQAIGKYQDTAKHGHRHRQSWICLQQRLEGESYIRGKAIASAQLLGEDICIHVVVEDGSDDEKDSQEHDDKDKVTQEVVDFHCLGPLVDIDHIDGKRPVVKWNRTEQEYHGFPEKGCWEPYSALKALSFDYLCSVGLC